MKWIYSIILFLTVTTSAQAQTCNCLKELDSVTAYIQRNYAGFEDKLKGRSLAYRQHTNRYRNMARNMQQEVACVSLIDNWLGFFKDHHMYLIYTADTATAKLQQYRQLKGSVTIADSTLKRVSAITNSNSIEGIYHNRDTGYRIAVIKSKKPGYDYVGVIIATKKDNWQPGEIKLQLQQENGHTYKVIWYDLYHRAIFDRISFDNTNGIVASGWQKENSQADRAALTQPLFEEEKKYQVYYQQLDSNTNYLRIRSFDVRNYPLIDSIVKQYNTQLTTKPYLVVDIRGNGGGGDISYRPLRSLLYTQPIVLVGPDMLATPENLDNFTAMVKDAGFPPNEEKEYMDLVARLRAANRKWVSLVDDSRDTFPQVLPNPAKVAVVIDEHCGSTAEQFLLEAQQSKKVTLYGQHTEGVLDYANVSGKLYPGLHMQLNYPTTRSRRINIGQGIDNVGVQPNVIINLQSPNWLQQVLQHLKQ